MRKARGILLALAVAGMVAARVNAQSIPPAKTADPFSGIHESLAQTVDQLAAAAASGGFENATKGEQSPEAQLPVARETERSAKAVFPPVVPLTPAMARLEQLRPMLDPILRSEGVPLDLAFVIVVESGGKSDALSPKGARGLWQLMPETARRYGLIVNEDRDERVDIAKSTRVAARYLRDLYTQFQSWPNALAAYNAGEQAVQRAIERGQSEDFGVLASRGLLPLETRIYVPAVVNLMAGSGDLSNVVGRTTQSSREARIVYAVRTTEGSEPIGVSEGQ